MSLIEGGASEGDYVIEAADPSDRLPFRDEEDRTHFLWVYQELFTHLGVRFPFTEFQREMMARCWVAASQLHLNGRPFWLNNEGEPFPWVYWNHEVKDCQINLLDTLETLASRFLQSFLVELGKKSQFKCRWIIDHCDAEVGALLGNMEKQTRFDRLRSKIAKVGGMGPRSILPAPTNPAGSAKPSASSPLAVVISGSSSGLNQRRRKRKLHESFLKNAVLGNDATWEHGVNPLNQAFPVDFDFRATLDSGVTRSSVTKALGPIPPEQLVGTAHRYACALSSKFKTKKELAAAKDQVAILTVERDTALTSPPLQAKIITLAEQLSVAQGERLSTLERLS
ncbi:hypothetical protein PIB30_091362 [Stylosanthes scabra]|uniref:Uncharacterized protein n=1 Tax=Stylosanthes scabra TaxID=79078 RepID=A0ABU6VT09_9FABA|nr:hypothetical protein [Stylosanthes scabra]